MNACWNLLVAKSNLFCNGPIPLKFFCIVFVYTFYHSLLLSLIVLCTTKSSAQKWNIDYGILISDQYMDVTFWFETQTGISRSVCKVSIFALKLLMFSICSVCLRAWNSVSSFFQFPFEFGFSFCHLDISLWAQNLVLKFLLFYFSSVIVFSLCRVFEFRLIYICCYYSVAVASYLENWRRNSILWLCRCSSKIFPTSHVFKEYILFSLTYSYSSFFWMLVM